MQVKVNEQIQTFNYAEMGFEDRRTGKPNEAWGLLRELAKAGGVLPNFARDGKTFIAIEKCMVRMRQSLKKHFHIASDPVLKDAARGYSCRFKIGCSPSFEK